MQKRHICLNNQNFQGFKIIVILHKINKLIKKVNKNRDT